MQTEIYTLPELTFVGGKTQELRFNLKDTKGESYNASGATVDFSVCNYSNKVGKPLFSITPVLLADENGIADKVIETENFVVKEYKSNTDNFIKSFNKVLEDTLS